MPLHFSTANWAQIPDISGAKITDATLTEAKFAEGPVNVGRMSVGVDGADLGTKTLEGTPTDILFGLKNSQQRPMRLLLEAGAASQQGFVLDWRDPVTDLSQWRMGTDSANAFSLFDRVGNTLRLKAVADGPTTVNSGMNFPVKINGEVGSGTEGLQVMAGGTNSSTEIAAITPEGSRPVRLSQAQRDGIASPTEGQTIWNTTQKSLQTFDGTVWRPTNGLLMHRGARTAAFVLQGTAENGGVQFLPSGAVVLNESGGANALDTNIFTAPVDGSVTVGITVSVSPNSDPPNITTFNTLINGLESCLSIEQVGETGLGRSISHFSTGKMLAGQHVQFRVSLVATTTTCTLTYFYWNIQFQPS